MKTNDEHILWLYVSGELDGHKSDLLEKRIESSKTLQDALKDIQNIQKNLSDLPTEKPQIDLIAPALALAAKRKPRGMIIFLRPTLALAATLLFILSLWVATKESEKTPEASVLIASTKSFFDNKEMLAKIKTTESAVRSFSSFVTTKTTHKRNVSSDFSSSHKSPVEKSRNRIAFARNRFYSITSQTDTSDSFRCKSSSSGFSHSDLHGRIEAARGEMRKSRKQLELMI